MDRVRTPYTRWAWLDKGQTYRVKLRWYPAPPGANAYPGHHLFSSGDWCEQDPHFPWPEAGEDKNAGRNFYAGEGPRQHYAGQTPIGDPEWYQSGVPLDVIEAALRNPPPLPPDYSPAGYGYPRFVPCDVQLLCATFRAVGPPLAVSVGGWRWGGRSKRCGTPTPLRTRGGWKWGGSTTSTTPRPPSASRGGWKWGGSGTGCIKRTRTAARGGWEWGGSTAWHLGRAVFQTLGGWRWGGSSTYCYPHTRVKTLGGWQWGGLSVSTFPGGNRRHAASEGDWRWGGFSTYSFTAGPCPGPDCCCELPVGGCPTLFAEFYGCTGACAVYNGLSIPLTSPDMCSRTPIFYTGSMPPIGGCPGFTFVFNCDHSVTPCQISITLQAGASCGYFGTLADPHTCTPQRVWDFGTLTRTAPMCCGGTINLRVHD